MGRGGYLDVALRHGLAVERVNSGESVLQRNLQVSQGAELSRSVRVGNSSSALVGASGHDHGLASVRIPLSSPSRESALPADRAKTDLPLNRSLVTTLGYGTPSFDRPRPSTVTQAGPTSTITSVDVVVLADAGAGAAAREEAATAASLRELNEMIARQSAELRRLQDEDNADTGSQVSSSARALGSDLPTLALTRPSRLPGGGSSALLSATGSGLSPSHGNLLGSNDVSIYRRPVEEEAFTEGLPPTLSTFGGGDGGWDSGLGYSEEDGASFDDDDAEAEALKARLEAHLADLEREFDL